MSETPIQRVGILEKEIIKNIERERDLTASLAQREAEIEKLRVIEARERGIEEAIDGIVFKCGDCDFTGGGTCPSCESRISLDHLESYVRGRKRELDQAIDRARTGLASTILDRAKTFLPEAAYIDLADDVNDVLDMIEEQTKLKATPSGEKV